VNSTTCLPCPAHSSGNNTVNRCYCDASYYESGEWPTTFVCNSCPEGAFCDGTGVVLTKANYWAPYGSNQYYACAFEVLDCNLQLLSMLGRMSCWSTCWTKLC
jgi:hypothetical protein